MRAGISPRESGEIPFVKGKSRLRQTHLIAIEDETSLQRHAFMRVKERWRSPRDTGEFGDLPINKSKSKNSQLGQAAASQHIASFPP